jgi:hypothetical protein
MAKRFQIGDYVSINSSAGKYNCVVLAVYNNLSAATTAAPGFAGLLKRGSNYKDSDAHYLCDVANATRIDVAGADGDMVSRTPAAGESPGDVAALQQVVSTAATTGRRESNRTSGVELRNFYRAKKAGLSRRLIACAAIPALVPNGTVEFDLSLTAEDSCCIASMVLDYATVPSSAAGTVVLELRKVSGGNDTLIYTSDLEALSPNDPSRTNTRATGDLPALTRVYGKLISDNADAVDGTRGLIALYGDVNA